MPKFLPWHFELIIASGVAEILLGLGVFFKKFRKSNLPSINQNCNSIWINLLGLEKH
jgi:uncharacterized membrane protein